MAQSTSAWDFIVKRQDLHISDIVASKFDAGTSLHAGEVLVKIDRYAFTANNITYAAFGEAMKYWQFYPAEEGWGRIPVWGYAHVVQSANPEIAVGERLFGYFPMSSYHVIPATRIKPDSLFDGSPHRAELAAAYNQYVRLGTAPAQDPLLEDSHAVLRPLVITSFLIDDYLDEVDFFGGKTIILSSASSKTSLGLAYALSKRKSKGIRVIGLTSPASRDFVARTGWYDDVVPYDAIATLRHEPSVFVDMAGNAANLAAIHNHLRDDLKLSLLVGGTHWDARGRTGQLPGPAPQFFFAPDRIVKRNAEWGREAFNKRVADTVDGFISAASPWFRIEEKKGEEAITKAYQAVLAGKCPPDKGYIFVM